MTIRKYIIENDQYSVEPEVTRGSPDFTNPAFRDSINRVLAKAFSKPFHNPEEIYTEMLKVMTRFNLSTDTNGGYGPKQKEFIASVSSFSWPLYLFGEPTGHTLSGGFSDDSKGTMTGYVSVSGSGAPAGDKVGRLNQIIFKTA